MIFLDCHSGSGHSRSFWRVRLKLESWRLPGLFATSLGQSPKFQSAGLLHIRKLSTVGWRLWLSIHQYGCWKIRITSGGGLLSHGRNVRNGRCVTGYWTDWRIGGSGLMHRAALFLEASPSLLMMFP